MQKPGMITGQKGVKYGLITRKDEKKPARPNSGRLAAFGGDSESEEDDVEAQVARQAARKVADSKVHDMYAAALAEDPNAFEYDSMYESMQEQKAAPKQQEKLARKPKYIASLLEQAEVRRREQGITYERVLLKERQKEDHMYDNTEKFITSAYRRKLEEDKQWQESQKLKELEEEQNDVTKVGHMNNFFTNLRKNVAMGGSGASSSRQTVADPAAEQTAAALEQPDQAASIEASGVSKKGHQQEAEQSEDDDPLEQQQGHEQQQQVHDQRVSEAPHIEQQHTAPHPGTALPTGTAVQLHPSSKYEQQHDQQQQQQTHSTPDSDEAPQAAAAVSGKRKNTDDAIAAARERYLARKRQQQG